MGTPLSYLTQAVKHGAEYRFHCEVSGGALNDRIWRLTTSKVSFLPVWSLIVRELMVTLLNQFATHHRSK